MTYETTDLGLVAFLRCKGRLLVDTKKDGGKVTFVFEEHPAIKQYVLDYFNGAEVSAIDFLNKLQESKTIMRQM